MLSTANKYEVTKCSLTTGMAICRSIQLKGQIGAKKLVQQHDWNKVLYEMKSSAYKMLLSLFLMQKSYVQK